MSFTNTGLKTKGILIMFVIGVIATFVGNRLELSLEFLSLEFFLLAGAIAIFCLILFEKRKNWRPSKYRLEIAIFAYIILSLVYVVGFQEKQVEENQVEENENQVEENKTIQLITQMWPKYILAPGENAKLKITVLNRSDTSAESVFVLVTVYDPRVIRLENENLFPFGSLAPYSSKTTEYSLIVLSDAPEGRYPDIIEVETLVTPPFKDETEFIPIEVRRG